MEVFALEIQEKEIGYNNPRNEMDDEEINDLKENLQLPELKFRWLWLLFGVPFFIDLYRYVKCLKQSWADYRENIKIYKSMELRREFNRQEKYINSVNNNIEELNFSENKDENERISQKNQIKELKVKLEYLNRLNKQKDKEIKELETKLHRCCKKLNAREEQNYRRHIVHRKGKHVKFLETKSTENISYHGINEYIESENDMPLIKPVHAATASEINNFLI